MKNTTSSVADILTNTKQSKTTVKTTVYNNLKTTVKTIDNYKPVDDLYDQLPDLVNQQFRAWYCQTFHKLGRDHVLKIASIAKADAKVDKRRYFSSLLKIAVSATCA